ncbi:MAG: c-type cytochrome [Acidimicrobiales bacterium]|nr:c-type cytochrome [Acidimicrobiales bacterium]
MSPVVLAATQQHLAAAFVVALVLGWAVFLFLSVKKSGEAAGDESATAPNRRPYLDDEGMEGPRLESAQKAAIAMLLVIVFGMPIYWLREPGRQANAIVGFDERAASRGFVLWQPADSSVPEGNIGHFGCGGCHGIEGQGGQTRYTLTLPDGTAKQVFWKAPRLDTVLSRYSEEEVTAVITYGRANTPMPAWGVEGGGPMNSQQVQDIIGYIKKLQLPKAEQQKLYAKEFADAGLDFAGGADLFDQFCARCHTKGWSYDWKTIGGMQFETPPPPGSGAFGFNLTNGSTLLQFPDIEDHIEFITTGSDFEKAYGSRGSGSGRMPGFGQMLTEAQIRAIVEYERSL